MGQLCAVAAQMISSLTMTSIYDAAKYILCSTGKINTRKLQKLCYYAQAAALAGTGKALFDENFEAWSDGPVCPGLYNMTRAYTEVDSAGLTEGNTDNLDADQQRVLDAVLAEYGGKTHYDLRIQVHSERPWLAARKDLPLWENSHSIISKANMETYYSRLGYGSILTRYAAREKAV